MNAFVRYAAARLGTGVLTLLAVITLVFLAIHLVPGSYAEVVLGPNATPEQRARLTAQYGLDEPVPLQYVRWLGRLLTGDLGTSFGGGEDVRSLLAGWLPVTVELAAIALLMTVLFGVPLALLAGAAQGRLAKVLGRFGGAISISTPDFVIGSVLLYIFSKYSLGLTVGAYVPLNADPIANMRAMILPAFTLAVFGIAVVVRTGRDSVMSALSLPHVAAAVARGESRAHILRNHVIRNSAIPVATVLATYTGYLLGGAVIVENLFSLPGIGQAVLNSIQTRNYPVVEGVVLVSAAAFIGMNILVDMLYGIIDPRVLGASNT